MVAATEGYKRSLLVIRPSGPRVSAVFAERPCRCDTRNVIRFRQVQATRQ
jgi:hypothetical protein